MIRVAGGAVRHWPVLNFYFVLFSLLEFEPEILVLTVLAREHDRFLSCTVGDRSNVDPGEV